MARTRGYDVMVLLENTAGGGATIGRSFEELAAILERRAKRRPHRRVPGYLPSLRGGL